MFKLHQPSTSGVNLFLMVIQILIKMEHQISSYKRSTKGILDGTIATADLADNAVNSAKIGADVIVAEDLANNAVTVNEITDGAITQQK